MAHDDAAEERRKTITSGSCPCDGSAEFCPDCEGGELPYWCEICRQAVAEKRCPLCGLKAKKIHDDAL